MDCSTTTSTHHISILPAIVQSRLIKAGKGSVRRLEFSSIGVFILREWSGAIQGGFRKGPLRRSSQNASSQIAGKVANV
jgi:hypothetical protein